MCARWLQDDRAYTFSLTMTFLTITFGAVLLVILLWLGTAMEGYQALQNAATSAAYAGESQVTAVQQDSGTGFGSRSWTLSPSRAQAAAQDLWQQEVQDEHLPSAFSNLQASVSVEGQDVIVQASGVFQPLFLEKLVAVFPQLIEQAAIPMQVRVKEEYYVAGD